MTIRAGDAGSGRSRIQRGAATASAGARAAQQVEQRLRVDLRLGVAAHRPATGRATPRSSCTSTGIKVCAGRLPGAKCSDDPAPG